jgi:hypothetical protein
MRSTLLCCGESDFQSPRMSSSSTPRSLGALLTRTFMTTVTKMSCAPAPAPLLHSTTSLAPSTQVWFVLPVLALTALAVTLARADVPETCVHVWETLRDVARTVALLWEVFREHS